MKVQGTAGTSTEVQRKADTEAAVLAAADAKLIADFRAAAEKATASAGVFAADVVALARTVDALHTAQTWSRQVDPATEKPFTSAKAYYAHLFESGESPLARPGRLMETILRRELVEALMDPDNVGLILGSNELAALVGVNQGTISRDVAAVTPELEAAKAVADAEAEAAAFEATLDEVAADAMAKAIEDGQSEEAAAYAAEVARAALKAEADKKAAEADAEAAKAKADEEAKAEEAATAKVVKSYGTATDNLLGRDHLLTPAQRATAREAAARVIEKLDALEAMIAKAEADVEAKARAAAKAAAAARQKAAAPKPGARRAAAASA